MPPAGFIIEASKEEKKSKKERTNTSKIKCFPTQSIIQYGPYIAARERKSEYQIWEKLFTYYLCFAVCSMCVCPFDLSHAVQPRAFKFDIVCFLMWLSEK